MADETRDVTDATDLTLSDGVTDAADQAVAPALDDDAILRAALGVDDDEDLPQGQAPAAPADEPDDEVKADAPAPAPSGDAASRGFEVLITQKGFTVAQAKALLEKNPDFVAEVGQAAIDAAAPADAVADPEPDAPADADTTEPEADASEPVTDEALTAKLAEILGGDFDAKESGAIAKAIGEAVRSVRGPTAKVPDVSAEIEKAVQARIEAANQQILRIDAQVSEMLARAEIGKLAEIHPELKDEAGVSRVFEVAGRMVKGGAKFKSMGELMEAAATIAYSGARTQEIKQYKGRVEKHRANGAPTTPGVRAGEGKAKSRDDLVLEMAFEGRPKDEIMNELARMSP